MFWALLMGVIAVVGAIVKIFFLLFVMLVNIVWEPQHPWQWSLLCGAFGALVAAITWRREEPGLMAGLGSVIGLVNGALVGAWVEPGMTASELWNASLWPFGG